MPPPHLYHGLAPVGTTKVQQRSDVVLLQPWLTEYQAWGAAGVTGSFHNLSEPPRNHSSIGSSGGSSSGCTEHRTTLLVASPCSAYGS